MKTNEEYSKENRALRRDIKELYSENTRMEKEITKLSKQLMEAESAIKNLKDELLKAQIKLALSRMNKKFNSKFSLLQAFPIWDLLAGSFFVPIQSNAIQLS